MRIATQIRRPQMEAEILRQLPRVEFIELPRSGAPPPGLHAEAYLTVVVGPQNYAEIIEGCAGLKWIHLFGTGVDGFPLQLIGDRLLTCSRGASGIAIAEWTLAMMLAFEKDLPNSWIQQPVEQWNFSRLGTLQGKVLGLVGFGGIAREIATRALAFDMQVQALVRTPRELDFPGVKTAANLSELLAQADHVVLALPSTNESRGLFNEDVFAQMKPGVHLVNIARGDIVDQDALRQALDAGTVARASLDAVSPEPLPTGHWMYGHEGVQLSPHISWSAPQAYSLLDQAFIDNVVAWSRGQSLSGVVDVAAGY